MIYLLLQGKRYPWVDLESAPLEVIDRIEDESGMTAAQIEDLWDTKGLHRSREQRQAMRVRIWLCRWAAGEDVSIAEATAGIPIGQMQLVNAEGEPLPPEDEPESADPTDPGPNSSTD